MVFHPFDIWTVIISNPSIKNFFSEIMDFTAEFGGRVNSVTNLQPLQRSGRKLECFKLRI